MGLERWPRRNSGERERPAGRSSAAPLIWSLQPAGFPAKVRRDVGVRKVAAG
jgi:hypothetical protein